MFTVFGICVCINTTVSISAITIKHLSTLATLRDYYVVIKSFTSLYQAKRNFSRNCLTIL